jgi:hypothetical protein
MKMKPAAIIATIALIALLSVAHADGNHLYLSCSHGHTTIKTFANDGTATTEQRDELMSYPIDVDTVQRTIAIMSGNVVAAVYHMPPKSFERKTSPVSSPILSDDDIGFLGWTFDDTSASTIKIDRLSGLLEEHTSRPSSCKDCKGAEMTTIYQCVPASQKF